MSPAGKRFPHLDSRPGNWDCAVQPGQFERGRAYRFFWELPLYGTVVFGGQTFRFAGSLQAQATMQRQGRRVIADIMIRANTETPCSRCLEMTKLALEQNFRYFYVSSDKEEERASKDEHTVITESEAGTLEISDQIWETLIMALPEKVLCRPDCKGLCPVCGCNRNYEECSCDVSGGDPRFAVLAEALDEDNESNRNNGGKGGR